MLTSEPSVLCLFLILRPLGLCCGMQAPLVVGVRAHWLQHAGLVAPWYVGSSLRPGDQKNPCLHLAWTTNPSDRREIPCALFGRKGVGIVQAFRATSRGGDDSLGRPAPTAPLTDPSAGAEGYEG